MLPKLRHDNNLCFVFVILDIHLFALDLDLSCKKLDALKDDYNKKHLCFRIVPVALVGFSDKTSGVVIFLLKVC